MPNDLDELSAGDVAFLGFLAAGLDTAYEIKKAVAGSISFFWSAAHSQVYQQASRLVRDGYVREREERTGRKRRLLSPTPKGRRALKAWLARPAEAAELRDEMLVKIFFAHEAGDPAATRRVLEGQRALYTSLLEEFEGIAVALELDDSPAARNGLLTLRLGIKVTRAYLEWLDETAPVFA